MPEMTPAIQGFVLHWGEMGSRWGINRTVAQIHALLYLSPDPLHAEAIAETLSVARSNVSNSLRELQRWGVVKVVHVMGDRRDHYECMKDVWEMIQVILDQRKEREFDPTLVVLRELVAQAGESGEEKGHTHQRLVEMLDFFESIAVWYTQIRRLPTGSVIRFVRTGEKIRELLGIGSGS
ncbi:MAG: GbsR/MarR family transcriptional regulator [Planctomycetota bacterium]|jgi:DNA-binding transcriptional regulator GbsR (MarR family)